MALLGGLLTALVLAPNPGQAPRVIEAALREVLRMTEEDSRLSILSVRHLCLAVEAGSDPTPEILQRLKAHSAHALVPYSQCVEQDLLVRVKGAVEGPVNLVAVDRIEWKNRKRAEVTIRMLSGIGVIVVTSDRRGWHAQRCCLGGLVGENESPQNNKMQA